jgi:DNA helicase IV
MDNGLFVGKTLYTRNGDPVLVTAISGEALTVQSDRRQYARNCGDVGKTLFTTNPLAEAAAEEYDGDTAFTQETQHLKDIQTELESFAGFLLQIHVNDMGFVVGTQTGFDEVTKEELIANPYFARMDVDIDDRQTNSLETAYVGKKGVYHKDRLLISDWRSDIGQKYYMKNLTRFTYNDMDYALLLRRALRIKNSVLTGYQDEYASSAYFMKSSSEVPDNLHINVVTDPFLQDIIRQKHTQNKLTDIIESIQENQNAIITRDENESLVVQGCAGSGKTMILLHRLSFIKYRNRNLELARIKILTPNRLFSLYINDLSKTLELEQIERLTVTEYYAMLLTRYYNMECVQLGRKCTPGDLLDYKTDLLYKESAAAGWPVIYSDSMREFIKKEAVQHLRYIFENRIKYRDVCAVLKDKLKYTLNDNVFDMRNITNLRSILQNVKAAFEAYYKQLGIFRQSEKALAAVEQKFNQLKAAVPDADALLDEIILDKLNKTLNLREKYEQKKRALLKQQKNGTPVDQEIKACDFCLCAILYDKAKHVFEVDKKMLREELDRIRLTEQEIALIESACRHAEEFSISMIEKSVLDTIEREYTVSLSFKNKLYVKLLIYYVILDRLHNGERLLCVDEGHDLYANEYRLFYLVNGSSLRFNIYGDVNQILSDGEGIADWDNLYSIFDFTLFRLNENYRNSAEIIEYCNDSLGFTTTNLGISGDPVQTLSTDGFINHLNNNILGTRKCAVIVKKKKPALLSSLREQLYAKLNPDEIKSGEIALLTPQEAKGLEFDTCYVFTKGMNRNEKYISYTRALNELYIIP